ncbi:hypothetical protein ACR75P_04150, partial [Faecalicoccus pleomorphus]|uniref:hypothetical protein n=1 Tax=Faecalicoccus pleomorphus TaxID=1323 RepID=UPI003DA4E0F6
QAKTKENKMLFLYSPDNNTRYFHLHTGKIYMKKPKSANCKLSLFFYRSVSFTAILPIYCDKTRIDRYTEYKQFSKCKEV